MLRIYKNSIGFRLVLGLILLGGLVLVRVFQTELFYDPFIVFFKGDYHSQPIPEIDNYKLISNIILRYTINATLSVAVIFILFFNKQLAQLTAIIHAVFFVVLLGLFSILLYKLSEQWYYLFFNVRRFLIHPILLILLIAAFYKFNKD